MNFVISGKFYQSHWAVYFRTDQNLENINFENLFSEASGQHLQIVSQIT